MDSYSRDKANFVVEKVLPPIFNVIVFSIDGSKEFIVSFLLSEERSPVFRLCRVELEWLKDVLDSSRLCGVAVGEREFGKDIIGRCFSFFLCVLGVSLPKVFSFCPLDII